MYDMEQKKKTVKAEQTETSFREALKEKFPESESERKLAVIVGASSGIGYETAIKLIGRNYRIVNISRTTCRLEQVANYLADVSDADELEKGILEIGAAMKNIDARVYCAGFSMAAPIEKAESEDVRYLFEVNFFGALRAIQAAVPFMKENGGRIVLVSSMGGILPIAFDCFYSCSKAALNMLAKSANSELGEFNIRATAVLPGGTATTFTFKRKVYGAAACGEYASRVEQAAASLADMEQDGMSAGEVAKVIVGCLENKNPPVVVHCGAMNKMYAAAERILPNKATLYLNDRKYFS